MDMSFGLLWNKQERAKRYTLGHSPNLLDHLTRHFFFICCNEKYPTPTGRRLPHTTLIYNNVIKTKQIVLTKWPTRRLSQLSGQTKYFDFLWCIVYCLPASGVRSPTILLLQIPIGQCHHYFTRSRNINHHVL
jgi:hypothetical protein